MNPLVDIYLNSHIRDKTVLIIGDALFGARIDNWDVPEVWDTFGGEFPNSIFLSTDPVAIDSVMYDFLNLEDSKPDESQLYLHRAKEVGLGTHDHWNNPTDKQYSRIDFRKIDMAFNLIAPTGGQIIPSGSIYTIQWEAHTEAVSFRLWYSMDNGKKWKLLEEDLTGNDYDWHVPTPRKNKRKCLIKLIAYDASGEKIGKDTSDSTFTIAVVTVTSPSGGETLTSGNIHTITWQTNETKNPVEKVKLLYTKNGGMSWIPIDTLKGMDPGFYDWKVPDVPKTKSKCRVKVVLKDKKGVKVGSDTSDDDFTIRPVL